MTTASASAPSIIPASLFEVLEQQTSLSQEMLALLEQEQGALTAVDVQGIVALSRRKANLLQRIQATDSHVQEIVNQLLLANGQSAKATLGNLIHQMAPSAERDQLSELRRRLLALREAILTKNLVNKHFAEDTGNYLRDAITLITNSVAENYDSYHRNGGKPGKRPPSANRPSLISREV